MRRQVVLARVDGWKDTRAAGAVFRIGEVEICVNNRCRDTMRGQGRKQRDESVERMMNSLGETK